MLTLKRRPEPVVTDAPQQYALVMLDEAQVSKLLGTPPMRRVNALPHPYDPHARYVQLRKRLTAAVTLVVVAATAAAAWRWAPRPAFAAVFPWSQTAAPTVGTAASFSVAVNAPPGADAAARVAGQLRGLALPVFTRRRPNTNAFQVMVGPYVSLDEAETAQRFLRARGYGSGRMFVDESVRNAPRNEATASPDARPGMLLVGAPDRLSLVLELEAQPRRVTSNRVSGTMFEVEMGPVPNPVTKQEWSAPAGVHLLRHVAVEETGNRASGGRFVKALVALPEFSQASVRVDGPRVYVDLTWPQHGMDGAPAPVPPRVHTRAAAVEAPAAAEPQPAKAAAARAPDVSVYREQVAPSIARFDEMTPFLLSAARSPSPAVLSALAETVKSLEATLASVTPPAEAADGHALIRSAAAAARTAMADDFAGDRTAQAQQAVNMFKGGKAALP